MRDWDKIQEKAESPSGDKKWLVMLLSGGLLLAGSFLAGGAWERSTPEKNPVEEKSEIETLKNSLAQLPAPDENTRPQTHSIVDELNDETRVASVGPGPVGAPSPVIRMAPPTPAPLRRAVAAVESPAARNSVDMAVDRRRAGQNNDLLRAEKRTIAPLPPAAPVDQALYIPKPTQAGGPGSLQSIPNEGARKEPKKLLQRGVRTKKALAPAQYTLQVRAFRELKDAMSLGENLNREGYQSYVVKSEIEGKGLWYRVRIGEFPSLKEATEFQTLFEESEQLSTFVSPL